MRIFGVSLVRNEAAIVGTTIAHHLALGCDHILVVDNGSTDGTPSALRELAATTGRVSWSVDAGPYRQSELLTGLARDAALQGADWVLPFDADEFWWVPRRRLGDLLASSASGALVASVRNFVQRREQETFRATDLLTMTRRVAVPAGPPERCRERVSSGEIGFVEMEYPPKAVIRAGPDVAIGPGNHRPTGVSGPIDATGDIVCLHAPLRSKEHLRERREHGDRVAEAFAPGQGWHARRWGDLVGKPTELDREWAANSYDSSGALEVGGQRHRLAVDPTLRDLLTATAFPRPWARLHRRLRGLATPSRRHGGPSYARRRKAPR